MWQSGGLSETGGSRMRRGQGLFATLLMLVPMTAVPIMAVVGIPQFVPQAVSSTERPVAFKPVVLESRAGRSAAPFTRTIAISSRSSDLFEPYTSTGGDQAAVDWQDPLGGVRERPSLRPAHLPDSRTETEPRDQIRQVAAEYSSRGPDSQTVPARYTSDPNPAPADDLFTPVASDHEPGSRYVRTASLRSESAASSAPKSSSLTWQQASARLEELGIHHFDLVRGSRPGEFRFMCLVTSADDPRISRRFEAEAGDPLLAVERVLLQIENWNASWQ